MQDLFEKLQFFFRFHISWTKHISIRPHLPECDKKKKHLDCSVSGLLGGQNKLFYLQGKDNIN